MKDQQEFKGPIIEVRGMLRLVMAGLPFIVAAYFSDDKALWMFGFICAVFATAGFIGIDAERRNSKRYAFWVGTFLLLAVYSAWIAAEHSFMLMILLVMWSTISSLSFSAGPIASLPVNIGCIVYMLLLLGNRLEDQSFVEMAIFTVASVGWSYLLGNISWLQGQKNHIEIPKIQQVFSLMKQQFHWQSTYTRTGVVRGVTILLIAVIYEVLHTSGIVITIFTILIAMQPGRTQTLIKVAIRVCAAIGAVVAASLVFNSQPPYWVYALAIVAIFIITRWIILRKYTYNSFFLITLPLFIISMIGYSENGSNKIIFTVIGGVIAIIASELFVFRGLRAQTGDEDHN